MIRGLDETARRIKETRIRLTHFVYERQKKVDEIRRIDKEIVKEREMLRTLYQQVMHFNRTLRRR